MQTMTMTYRDRDFLVTALTDDGGVGWGVEITEVFERLGETAEWEGDCLLFETPAIALAEGVRMVIETVDDDAGEAA